MTFWQVALNILYVIMRQTLRPTEQQTKQRLTCLFWCYRTEYRNFILFGTDQNVTVALSRYKRLALDVSKSSNHVDQIVPDLIEKLGNLKLGKFPGCLCLDKI